MGSMKLLVLLSSCLVVSNALPLIDYIYKGYEQAPYTVTADYNGIETRKYPEAWWACTEGSVAVTGEERVGSEWSLPGVINYMTGTSRPDTRHGEMYARCPRQEVQWIPPGSLRGCQVDQSC